MENRTGRNLCVPKGSVFDTKEGQTWQIGKRTLQWVLFVVVGWLITALKANRQRIECLKPLAVCWEGMQAENWLI
jgi:hypothetical protein